MFYKPRERIRAGAGETLLCKKSYYCKPITGLKISCKSILGLSVKM